MGSLRRRAAAFAATATIAGLAGLTTAPAAQAQECIATAYDNGYRVWCASGAAGTEFRARTTCRLSGSYATYYVYGTWEKQAANRWSYALCPSGWYPVQIAIQTR